MELRGQASDGRQHFGHGGGLPLTVSCSVSVKLRLPPARSSQSRAFRTAAKTRRSVGPPVLRGGELLPGARSLRWRRDPPDVGHALGGACGRGTPGVGGWGRRGKKGQHAHALLGTSSTLGRPPPQCTPRHLPPDSKPWTPPTHLVITQCFAHLSLCASSSHPPLRPREQLEGQPLRTARVCSFIARLPLHTRRTSVLCSSSRSS